MGLFEHFPYTNFHDLNLNWILGKIKDIDSTVAGVHQAEENAAASAESAAESAESAAASAEAASGSAEAAAGSAEAAAEAEAGASGVVRDVSDRLTAFIQQHSGPSDETILYSAPGDPVYSGNLTLDEDPSTYMHLKIVWKHRNNVCVQEFPADMINDMYVRDTLGAPGTGGGSDLYEIAQMVLKHTTGTTVQIASARVVDSTGYASGDVDGTMNTGVVRIVGVKNVADTEVVDARVGADGTIYPTLEARLNAESTSTIPYEVKQAMDALFAKAAYLYADAYDDYMIFHEWATSLNLISIEAVYNQSGPVYSDDSLDVLRNDLTVTALFSDGTTQEITAYTLSGTLTEGVSTITVAYEDKTDTFTVNVSAGWTLRWDYTYGGLPAAVQPNDWTVSETGASGHSVTFESGMGLKFSGTGGGYTIIPRNYQNTTDGVTEIVVNFNQIAAGRASDLNVRATLNSPSDTLIGFLFKDGVKVNGSGSDYSFISGTAVGLNEDHVLRVERTASTGKVYLDGNEVYSGELRSLTGTNNILISFISSTGENCIVYLKSIRFRDES